MGHENVDDHGQRDLHADRGVPLGSEVGVAVAANVQSGNTRIDEDGEHRRVDDSEEEEPLREGLRLGVEAVVRLPLAHLLQQDLEQAIGEGDDCSSKDSGRRGNGYIL